MRRIAALPLIPAALLTAAVFSWTAAAAPARLAPTTGAVKLNAAQVKTVEKVRCGQIRSSWLPGATVGGKFLAHSKRAANYTALAKRASGKKARTLRAQATKYAKLGRTQAAACRQPNGAAKLPSEKLKQARNGRTRVQCGQLGRAGWLPGTLSAGYFVSHAQQATNFTTQARFAKGAAKRRLQTQATAFKARAASQLGSCRVFGKPDACPNIDGVQTSVPAGMVKDSAGNCVKPDRSLRFNLSGAAGLALSAQSTTTPKQPGSANTGGGTGSNLDVVMPNGQLKDAIAQGAATVSKFLIAPNGKVYLVFNPGVNLDDPTDKSWVPEKFCLLAEVDGDTGVPVCVATRGALDVIWWGNGMKTNNPSIQFDGSGAVYYAGHASGKTILRRYSAGATTDLITDQVHLNDFLVNADGSVFVTGQTMANNQNWTRRIAPQGGLQTLANRQAWFLQRFPDGNVYFGESQNGVRRFLTATNSVESKYWIGHSVFNPGADYYYDGHAICTRLDHTSSACGTSSNFSTTLSGKVYALDKILHNVMRLYPDVAKVPTSVTKPTLAFGVLNHVVIAGLNGSDQNVLYLHDTADGSETELIGPSSEIEIYHLDLAAASGKVLFDGLRFADNKYVLGEVNVNTGEVRTVAALGAKWEDFQTFG